MRVRLEADDDNGEVIADVAVATVAVEHRHERFQHFVGTPGAFGEVVYGFFLDGVVLDAGLKLADGMHPNAKGVDVMVEKMEPAVTKFVETISSVNK